MRCPQCNTELRIMSSRLEVTGDDSPETPTQVWRVLEMGCVNPQCTKPEPIEERVRIYPPEENK